MDDKASSIADKDDDEANDDIHPSDKVQGLMTPSMDQAPSTSINILNNNAYLGILKWAHESASSKYDKESLLARNDNIIIALIKLPIKSWTKIFEKKKEKSCLEDEPQFK